MNEDSSYFDLAKNMVYLQAEIDRINHLILEDQELTQNPVLLVDDECQ